MTREEQAMADDLMRAEIAKLIAETSRINAEARNFDNRVRAEIGRMDAEAAKVRSERFWIPFTVFAGAIVAIVTAVPRLLG